MRIVFAQQQIRENNLKAYNKLLSKHRMIGLLSDFNGCGCRLKIYL